MDGRLCGHTPTVGVPLPVTARGDASRCNDDVVGFVRRAALGHVGSDGRGHIQINTRSADICPCVVFGTRAAVDSGRGVECSGRVRIVFDGKVMRSCEIAVGLTRVHYGEIIGRVRPRFYGDRNRCQGITVPRHSPYAFRLAPRGGLHAAVRAARDFRYDVVHDIHDIALLVRAEYEHSVAGDIGRKVDCRLDGRAHIHRFAVVDDAVAVDVAARYDRAVQSVVSQPHRVCGRGVVDLDIHRYCVFRHKPGIVHRIERKAVISVPRRSDIAVDIRTSTTTADGK